MLRDDLNAILSFIGDTSLTDEEFNSLPDVVDTDTLKFSSLKSVLGSRESVSDMYRKLTSYFKAKGMTFGSDSTPSTDLKNSDIFVGSKL